MKPLNLDPNMAICSLCHCARQNGCGSMLEGNCVGDKLSWAAPTSWEWIRDCGICYAICVEVHKFTIFMCLFLTCQPFKPFPAENKSQVLSLKKPWCHGYWLDHQYRTPICGSFFLWLSGALSIKQHASSLEGQPTCSQKLKDWVVTKIFNVLNLRNPNRQFH